MKICFITYMYPAGKKINSFPFVKQLVDEIASKGHECCVLVPFNVFHYRCMVSRREEYTVGKGRVTVVRPPYLSFAGLRLGKINVSAKMHEIAMKKAFRMMKMKPDVIYGHFWSSAYAGFDYAKKNSIPLFVATGESEIRRLFSPKKNEKSFADYVSGVICVSSKNRDESISLGLTTIDKCAVFPNAVNTSLFYKQDKEVCRKKLGLPSDAFIVAFVGFFIERKGPQRVASALSMINDKPVYALFIGKGEQEVTYQNTLFKGPVPHEQVPQYLNAADVFVLPTLHEGCCNAVVEALSCGLPVVSSNLPFNWDVLNASNSIMVDPMNIGEIKESIMKLRDDKILREGMEKAALQTALTLNIDKRADAILDFMKSKMDVRDE